MRFSRGDKVEVPGGAHGEVLRDSVRDELRYTDDGNRRVVVYPVLMGDGEVRFFRDTALSGAPDDIRGTGSLL